MSDSTVSLRQQKPSRKSGAMTSNMTLDTELVPDRDSSGEAPSISSRTPDEMDDIEEDAKSNSTESVGISSTNSSSRGDSRVGKHGAASTDGSFNLAKDETRRVKNGKRIMFTIILLTAIAVGTCTYFITQTQEHDVFKVQFTDYAESVVKMVHHQAELVFQAVDNFAAGITSNTLDKNQSWPLLTPPHFEVRAVKNNRLSKVKQLTFSPLVSADNRTAWEDYSVQNQGWIETSWDYQQDRAEAASTSLGDDKFDIFRRRNRRVQRGSSAADVDDTVYGDYDTPTTTATPQITPHLWKFSEGDHGTPERQTIDDVDFGPASFAPLWQVAPAPPNVSIINYDYLSHPVFRRFYRGMWDTRLPVLSEVDIDFDFLLYDGNSSAAGLANDEIRTYSLLLFPMYPFFHKATLSGPRANAAGEKNELKGFLTAIVNWDSYFEDILNNGVNGMIVVLENTCGQTFTYRLNGPNVVFEGIGELYDGAYESMEIRDDFAPFLKHTLSEAHEHCEYDFRLFPSAEMEAQYYTMKPIIYTCVVLLVFLFTAGAFSAYDFFVEARQSRVMATARRTDAIVNSMFPSGFREKILDNIQAQVDAELGNANQKMSFKSIPSQKSRLKTFLNDGDKAAETNHNNDVGMRPIADLFPATTVMFGDIAGFTAWSSVREPAQVFTLLETLYGAFDDIARRRRVFKVETIGDCYVAVAGLPEPRADHAIVMARFARDCLMKMNELTKKLEITLGPDTGDLLMRIGLHSGPVTAGVLRGDKSRFQLFGDTVNTASRMESTCLRNHVQMSQETANLLIAAGKGHWVQPRKDNVVAKGKGEMHTFFLTLSLPSGQSQGSGKSGEQKAKNKVDSNGEQLASGDVVPNDEEKHMRLVDWTSEVLLRLLKQVVARREAEQKYKKSKYKELKLAESNQVEDKHTRGAVIEEVAEIIHLPEFDAKVAGIQVDGETIDLGHKVTDQMHAFVSIISKCYRLNPFHNFEHASHVTMSVVKLLSRIVAPDYVMPEEPSDLKGGSGEDKVASSLHDHTYGITSDPLTQFSCVFAALIHDVDHTGVPNAQLVKEKNPLATFYKDTSVAEQNSVDIAWEILMDADFEDLRAVIYSTESELRRFRQLVVNCVMATDIVDKELKNKRNSRWEKAFSQKCVDEDVRDTIDRKATIVIEHLLQASDVSHTMQHWHIYRKWNERFFHECYRAFKQGRAENNPADSWYKGEIGFFDFYIIPLAKKLKDCGVFGVSSDEYLNYAEKNRNEWESKGKEVVESMVATYEAMYLEEECPTANGLEI